MNVFDLVASLTLDTKEYERALYQAKATTTSATNDISKKVGAVKKGFLVGAGAMAAGFAAFGVSSVKTGAQFDSAMSQVAATMGKTMDEMEDEVGTVDLAWGKFSGNLRDYAKEMGAHTKFSATESAEALNYMALAGYDAQKSMEMLPTVLNLAAAGNMELADASDMVTDASSALGLSQKETVEMVDQMAMASSKSNTSVAQLGSAFLTVGGTAKLLKGGTAELSAELGVLADNGIKGSEGGTALRNVLLSIQRGKFDKTFGQMGVEAYDAEGHLRSLPDILADMNEAMEGMSDKEKSEIIAKTFNARDLKSVNALLGTSKERWEQLGAAIEDSEGSAQKMADTQLDNLTGDITIMKSAWEGFQISMSEKVSPALREIVQGLTWMIDHASTLLPIILGLATAFGVFAIAINIGSIIAGVTKAMTALNAVLLANPIGIIVALVAGLVVAFITLWKNNEQFRNKVIKIWNSIKSAASSIFGSIKEIASTVWEAIKEHIVKPIMNAKETISNIFSAIREIASTAWSGVKSIASKAWEGVKNAIVTPIRASVALVSAIISKIRSIVSSGFNAVRSVASKVWNRIKTAITNPIDSARNKVKSILDKLKGLFPLKIGKIFSGIKLPHFKVSGSPPFGLGGKGKRPSIGVSWYKKAYDTPYLFTNPTVVSGLGFGDGVGDEMVYGKQSLMNDITDAMAKGGTGGNVINIYSTVNNADNPEEYAERLVGKIRLAMRTA